MAVYARGGDPQAMRAAARRLAQQGRALESVANECERARARLGLQWGGRDRETANAGLRAARSTIGDLCGAVYRLADTLDRNAAAQEAASAETRSGLPAMPAGGDRPILAGPAATKTDPDTWGSLDPWVASRWQAMTTPERLATLQQMADGIALNAGIPPRRVVVGPLGQRILGSAAFGTDFVTLAPAALADPTFAVNCLAHEMRHAIQFQLVTEEWRPDPIVTTLRTWGVLPSHLEQVGVSRDTVKSWGENLYDYKDVETDGVAAYRNQPIEADAFRAGEEFVNRMNPVKFSFYRLSALLASAQ